MTWNRKCSTHPKEPAVASETRTGQRRKSFCASCWDHHRVTVLRHSPTFDAYSLMGQGVKRFGFTPVADMAQNRQEIPMTNDDQIPRRAYR